jgi:Fe-Mn family superoxide dismutase
MLNNISATTRAIPSGQNVIHKPSAAVPVFSLPDLPYGYDALHPAISEVTMRTHHDKHHAAYIETTNKLLAEQPFESLSLEEVVKQAAEHGQQKLFNQSAQAWNHGFFWECMTPHYEEPRGEIAESIKTAFGGLSPLRECFVEEGAGHFGSGWVWLLSRNGELVVVSTHDGNGPLTSDRDIPILACDLWEHAYYLDYKNGRKQFLQTWFDQVTNWRFAADQYAASQGQTQPYRFPSAQ